MNTASNDRIDQLALVWLLVPRKVSRVADFATQLKHVASGVDDRKRMAAASIARLREGGMIQPTKRLELTEKGRQRALEALGVARVPQSRTAMQWVKKTLLLRSIGVEPTAAALMNVGEANVLAARLIARHHQIDRKIEASPSKVMAVLARRALGLEEQPDFKLDEAFSELVLRGGFVRTINGDGNGVRRADPAFSTIALDLADCKLPEFADRVNDAARSSRTGRWHGAVFISHVWNTLRALGDVGITFEKFQRRLVDAHQADLIELSRADLVDTMTAADVSASETIHGGARFHFVRLEQLAS